MKFLPIYRTYQYILSDISLDRYISFDLPSLVSLHQQTNCASVTQISDSFSEKQLLVLLEDFFMAGSETTSSTMMFVMYYLIKYPEIQAKIHEQLDQVVGFDQIPSVNHRPM